MSSPYADAAPDYLAGGFSPIRLPLMCKNPPPVGFTGYLGVYVDVRQVEEWSTGRHNIGLRLPETVLGIDCDDYDKKTGGASLAAAEDRLGPLPPTWRSTSRETDLVSGIRFYRVPAGRQWADEVGLNVEIIHHGHRYAVVAPSIHPDGRTYGWFDPDGLPTNEAPTVAELPPLPEAWVGALVRGKVADRSPRVDLTYSDVGQWLSGLADGPPCRVIVGVLASAERGLDSGSSRHDVARHHVLRIVRHGEQGHAGAMTALDTLQSMFVTALDGDRGNDGEWERMVAGAVSIAVATPTDGEQRGCCSTAAEDFALPWNDDLLDATTTLRTIRQAAHHRMVSAPALLCYVLARVLAEVPPAVALPPVVGSPASLNLGVAVVGDSGSGKSALLAVSRELLGLTGAWQEDIERSVGSGEGLVQQFLRMQGTGASRRNVLIDDPRRIMTIDEIDNLGATKHRNGSTIAPILRSALTGGPLGQANATADRDRHVPSGAYRLVTLLGVQPTRSETLLEDADAGTPQRLIWVFAKDPSLPEEDVPWPGPLAGGDWDLPAELPRFISYPDHIKAEIRAARRQQVKAGADPLAGHMLLTRLKVATALALLHHDVSITDQWWGLAGHLVDASMAVQVECRRVLSTELAARRRAAGRLDGVRAEGAAEYRNERAEQAAKAIWKQVDKHANGAKDSNQKHEPKDGCTDRCITNALRNYADKVEIRDPAVEHAAEADWIEKRADRWFPGDSRPA